MHDLYNSTVLPVSYIQNTVFKDNIATNGGAIHLYNTHLIQISENKFIGNIAVKSQLSKAASGNGGAILYTCNPKEFDYTCTVALVDNDYTDNAALRKGGALRYENVDFDTTRLIDPKDEVALSHLTHRHLNVS